ncbi:SGNH/GDSL hydrolase family protein [Actinoplanes sp. NPDC026619]|uniref:SGNH/GDSL hydrolase family protein n=1 Tax=Actinoplanes sp. NPDC026619 TaxID=3155798 RepID=UPI0033C5DFF0
MRSFRAPVVSALTLLLSFTGTPATAAGPRATPRYVALGDSYSSGVGSGGSESAGACRRNTNAFPVKWAKAHPGYDAVFAACSGSSAGAVRETQLSALTSDTALVSLTAGGNDIGFARTMTVCVLDPRASTCLSGTKKAREVTRNVLPGRLKLLYTAIRDRAPGAKVLVLGYPRFYRGGGAVCRGLQASERAAINGTIDALDEVIEQQATAAGLHYVEVRNAFAGHELCTAAPWLNGAMWPPANSYHPNRSGQLDGYLPAMTAVTG